MTEPLGGAADWSDNDEPVGGEPADQQEHPQSPQEPLPLGEGGSEDTGEGESEPPAPDGGDPEASEGDQPPEPERKESREARYRRERNEARTEVDELQQQVRTLQASEIMRLAGQHLADPGDLWVFNQGDLDALVSPYGVVDADKVNDAVNAILKARPGLAKGARGPASPDFGQGKRGGSAPKTTSWVDVLKGG